MLDGIFLSLLIRELLGRCRGARVDKIFQPARDELVLLLRGKTAGGRLLVCARPSASRVHLTESAPENPAAPPMFCMLLRKRLLGATLTGIAQEGLDRVARLRFTGRNELGDTVEQTLVAELTGRQPNILLLDHEGRIVDAVQRSSAEAARLLMPGALYEPPPAPRKLDLFTDDLSKIVSEIRAQDCELSKAVQAALDGFSPLIAREIAHQTGRGAEISGGEMNEEQATRLRAFLSMHRELCERGGRPHLFSHADGAPFEFSYAPLSQYGAAAAAREYGSYCELLDAFYAERERLARLRAGARDVQKVLTTAMERASKKLNLRLAELKAGENREQLRIYGELVKSNLHKIGRGDSFCQATNYYEPDCPDIRIPLNPALSPAANAQKYFKAYRKANTAAQLLTALIGEAQAERAYLETVSDALARAESDREIAEIRDELTAAGYIRKPPKAKQNAARKSAALPPLSFQFGAFEILVGRNNRQNDELTLKTADAKDVWLHVKTVPGSHVILRANGKEPPADVLREAARLAALHSSAKDTGGIEVDYTLAKYVKKPPGAKPGMVTYDKYRSIFVKL